MAKINQSIMISAVGVADGTVDEAREQAYFAFGQAASQVEGVWGDHTYNSFPDPKLQVTVLEMEQIPGTTKMTTTKVRAQVFATAFVEAENEDLDENGNPTKQTDFFSFGNNILAQASAILTQISNRFGINPESFPDADGDGDFDQEDYVAALVANSAEAVKFFVENISPLFPDIVLDPSSTLQDQALVLANAIHAEVEAQGLS